MQNTKTVVNSALAGVLALGVLGLADPAAADSGVASVRAKTRSDYPYGAHLPGSRGDRRAMADATRTDGKLDQSEFYAFETKPARVPAASDCAYGTPQ